MTKPTIGALVLYTTASGAILPAVVVNVREATEETPETANLQVFTDESLPNLLHISDVGQGDAPEAGKFHFAADVAPAEEAAPEKPAKSKKPEKGAE